MRSVGENLRGKMSRTVLRRSVAVAIGCLLLVGCANRPSADELTQSIIQAANNDETVALTDDQARCIADEIIDSDLSDTTVAGLAENFDQPRVLASDADEVEQTVADAAIICANR